MIRTVDFKCKCGNNTFEEGGGVSDGIAYYKFINCLNCGKGYELHPTTKHVYFK